MRRLVLLVAAAVLLVACCAQRASRTIDAMTLANERAATAELLVRDSFDGSYSAFCSAVWLGRNELITAAHCVDDAGLTPQQALVNDMVGVLPDPMPSPIGGKVAFATWHDYLERNAEATIDRADIAIVVAFDAAADLATLRVAEWNGPSIHDVAIVGSIAPDSGEIVHIVGHTAGLEFTYTPGVVSAQRRTTDPHGRWALAIQTVSGASHGNSGGGLFNDAGQLVGIASFMLDRAPVVFFVHTSTINTFLAAH